MREAIAQAIDNLRANRLRSVLTMFGILWGVIAVVVLSATGEGFQRGNQTVLEELGKNIAIVWGGRTTKQAGGERAGRQIFLTLDDARAIAAESSLAAVVSPEINRNGLQVKSRYNAAALGVHGIEPQYQDIRTIDVERGRVFGWPDETQVRRVAIIGADAWQQLTSTTAMFLNCRVLYCNRVGFEDGVNFWGGSEYVAPSGESLVRGRLLEEDSVAATLDEGALRRERIFSPMLRDENLFVTMQELRRIERERRL